MKTNLRGFILRAFVWSIFLLFPATLAAQEVPFRVSVFAGFSFLDGERAFVLGDDFFRSDFDNGLTIGGRATADVTDIFALEVAYGLSKTDLNVFEEGPPLGRRDFDINIHRLDGNGHYYFRPVGDPLRPFVTAGIGLARFSPTSDARQDASVRFIEEATRISSSNMFSFNFGVGLENEFSDRMSWRADLRDHVTGTPRFGVPQTPLSPGGVSYPVSGAIHNI